MKKTYSGTFYCWREDIVAAAKLLDLAPEEVERFMKRKAETVRLHRRRNFRRQ